MTDQQGDVLLFNTPDGGEIDVSNGIVTMTHGLGVAAYLSLFGGNEADGTLPDDRNQWWGNLDEPEPSRRYRSQTQHLLARLSATPGNLRRLEDAALRDLQWFLDQRIANRVTASASIPGLNRVTIAVDIEAQGERTRFEFTENWEASL